MTRPKKPLLMRRNDFIAELGRVLNAYDLPPVIMQPILQDYLKSVEDAMNGQYAQDEAEYKKVCEEYEAACAQCAQSAPCSEVTGNG